MKKVTQVLNARSRNKALLAGQPIKFSDSYISLMVGRTSKISSALDRINKRFGSQKNAVETAILKLDASK
jgi:hypothetical protein